MLKISDRAYIDLGFTNVDTESTALGDYAFLSDHQAKT